MVMDPRLTELNEKFISLVKNRPDLYKHRFRKDRDQDDVDRLWREISAQMPWKGEKECRYRWGVLRNCYARALREEGNNKYSVKPWYLQEQMSFLKPYIKTYKNCSMEGHSSKKSKRSASASSSKSPSSKPKKEDFIDSSCFLPSSVQQFSISEMEACKAENTHINNESDMKLDNIGTLSVDEASNCSRISIKSSPIPFTERFLDEPVFETKELQQQNDFEVWDNSNKLFLTSLLPDLNKLSERKQRIFKRKTLELLETLFDEPTHNSSLPTIQYYGHLYDQNLHLGLNQ